MRIDQQQVRHQGHYRAWLFAGVTLAGSLSTGVDGGGGSSIHLRIGLLFSMPILNSICIRYTKFFQLRKP